jgi:hypothetical protein
MKMLPNQRIKLTACGTLTHGRKRRRSHAAAYPQRYPDRECFYGGMVWDLVAYLC